MERVIRHIRVIALLGVLTMYFGCVQKSAQLQKGIAPPDRTLFETGEAYLKNGQYNRARLTFQNLLNTYPDSDVAADAYFAMGDTFYEEGGTENLLQAVNQYKDFITLFSGDPIAASKLADAQMKIVSAYFKQMRTPDRDQQYAYLTLEAIETLERRYPNSDYIPIARQLKIAVEDNLARGDLGIGEQYLRSGNLAAAMGRFESVTEKYKNFEDMDTVLYRIGTLWERAGSRNPDPDAAAISVITAASWYSKLAEGYPFSKYYEAAKRRLTELGFEIPEVNETLAAANAANIRPSEGFSPLKPLIDFAEALGFRAPPDLFETAQKTIEEEKNQASAKTAAGTGTGTGDDIQIVSEIRQSASGTSTVETSSQSSGSGESPDVSRGSNDEENMSGDAEQERRLRYQRKP